MFLCKYFEIFKNSFFIEHLRWLLLYLQPSQTAITEEKREGTKYASEQNVILN